ncbi:MAG: prolyl oligopeptidase family serine peptidase [Simplicispira suum]|uniref:extracellular catalytic domain type 1 short-chain-length polyhydroxyalkanoate depolymerase n=1 Tax=Simplicispira suum TaxID=2109915 RepID=UPI001C6B19C9|nr:PHB depolymerase family esterase [Simplicispira suum]MBW7833104.1 prolyl oligopeptidase family serine peptidase [Simplicispira suum]
MARRPASPLLALARAYQRQVRALARAARPARTPAAPLRVPARKRPQAPKPAAAKRAPPAPAALGQWLAGIAPGPAGARRYHLYVPPGVTAASRMRLPLLVMLHGCGQTGHSFAASTRMNQRAARERFLVLYPEQERMANAQGCWNWFERRSGRADAEADTVLAAIDQVARRYAVHPDRIGVAGMSAGASMAAWLALRAPQRFCALAMHSGAAPGSADSAATALAAMRGDRLPRRPEVATGAELPAAAPPMLPPLLLLHGESDPVVSVRSAQHTAAWWAQALGARAGAPRMQQRGARRTTRLTEFRARGRVQVALREIEGLGHAWSGGAPRVAYSDPTGPDASALVWAFMARQFAGTA